VYWFVQALSSFATRTGLWVKGRWIKSPFVIDAAIVTAVFAAQLVFRRMAYDGEWLPNTYFAKSGGFWKGDAWEYPRGDLHAARERSPSSLAASAVSSAVDRIAGSSPPRPPSLLASACHFSPARIGCRGNGC
jgi:hypothetical protein